MKTKSGNTHFSSIDNLYRLDGKVPNFIEIAENPDNVPPKLIRTVLEKKLAEANPSMGDKVQKGICGDTRINFLEEQTYLLYQDLMVYRGAAATQLKQVHVIHNEFQRKFFFGHTDYSCEVVR